MTVARGRWPLPTGTTRNSSIISAFLAAECQVGDFPSPPRKLCQGDGIPLSCPPSGSRKYLWHFFRHVFGISVSDGTENSLSIVNWLPRPSHRSLRTPRARARSTFEFGRTRTTATRAVPSSRVRTLVKGFLPSCFGALFKIISFSSHSPSYLPPSLILIPLRP